MREDFETHSKNPIVQQKIKSLAIPYTAVGVGIDIYIFVVPIVGIWRLQLSSRQKIGLAVVFMAGAM